MIELSVIVPCYNSAGYLEKLLRALQKQTLTKEKLEIIIVDDGSTDQTASLLANYPFTYLFQKNKGAGAARNLGAKKAKGEIFLFVDSDCVVSKNWAEKHLENHEKYQDFAIIGGGVKKPKESSLIGWSDFFSSWFNAHEDLKKHEVKEYLPSLNLSVERKAFDRIGGFWQKKMTGEDVDFCFRARRAGMKILFDPSLAVYHQSPGFLGFFKHNFNWGYHAPFLRGRKGGLTYHFLFSGHFLKSLILFWPIVFGYTLFLASCWWRYQPLRFLICLPLIFLGKFVYGLGFLKGVWQKSFSKR